MEKITSVKNQKIKDLLFLKKNPSQNFFIEGDHLCEEALLNGKLVSLYVLETQLPSLPSSLQSFPGPTFALSEIVAAKLSDTKKPTGVYGIATMTSEDNQVWPIPGRILVLDDVQDPGNLGTLLRSAAAFGFPNVLISPHSVNFYNEKVIRSTQGLLFKLHLKQAPLETYLPAWKKTGLPIIGTNLHQPYQALPNLTTIMSPCALILGNEGHGLSPKSLEWLTTNVLIPMAPEVESLNVGVAGSILMYEINQKG
ncbi:TrmH family RNA methyltransferase [Entomoplasma freundtii]|uniref:RNA methyltransferase, TrmH family n=1 Tax=Entomoplasma freundtii TaxID=74700 RepID=A0A2K8NRQ2_9MOLU|nr:RNA methyltransferase [Entomoplasma freundtii]ATZ16525.1 RNA methyltransferase, TrmH family [Entomoplasma freundtii]TDY58309.1 TrmH family RNA methyltransferase [Entomoplasma freundtii]